jgi:DNA repair protein RadC
MEPSRKHLNIKAWAEEDRPREKLLHKGKRSLSLAELLAILMRSGSTSESAVELARRLLQSVDQDIHQLAKLNIKELMRFKGIGEAKAISIVAALEVGRRREMAAPLQKAAIKGASDVHELLAPLLADLPHEEFWILLLNRSNKVIGRECISTGGVSGTVADVKIIFKRALEHLASNIILCHNHPSGNLKPSHTDEVLTRKVAQAGEVLDIQVLDHVIIAETGYFSFADEGKL